MKTVKEIKDRFAVENGYSDWDDLMGRCDHNEHYIDSVMEEYAKQVIESRLPSEEECKAYADRYSLWGAKVNHRLSTYIGFISGARWLISKLREE